MLTEWSSYNDMWMNCKTFLSHSYDNLRLSLANVTRLRQRIARKMFERTSRSSPTSVFSSRQSSFKFRSGAVRTKTPSSQKA